MNYTTIPFDMNTTDSLSSNSSLSGMMNATVVAATVAASNKGKMFGVLIKVVYTIGIIGNAAAIVTLRRGESRIRNRKHLLMLTSLAANDLLALVRVCLGLFHDFNLPSDRSKDVVDTYSYSTTLLQPATRVLRDTLRG